MERAELEKLGDAALRKLVDDAQAVLEARAKGAGAPVAAAPVFTFGAPARSDGGLFGAPAAGGGLFGAPPAGGGLFGNPAASGGGLFGAGAGGAKLFGGSGGGLFSTSTSGGGLFGAAGVPGGAAGTGSTNDAQGDGGQDEEFVKEEEVLQVTGWQPSMTLEVKGHVDTGEENEEQLYSQRSKLLRFKDGEWKERGIGEAKLLKHKTTGKIRFLLRQEKTGKVVANHLVIDTTPYCDLRPNAESDKCWVWSALDCAEEEQKAEQFALKFGQAPLAAMFKEAFDAAKRSNADIAAS